MDKISNILPPSARVRAAEIADAQPVRPGAPSFGRPAGRNSLGDRLTLSKQLQESLATGEEPKVETPKTYKNTAEGAKAQVIAKLSENFFSPKAEVRGSDLTSSQEVLKSVEDTDDLGSLIAKN